MKDLFEKIIKALLIAGFGIFIIYKPIVKGDSLFDYNFKIKKKRTSLENIIQTNTDYNMLDLHIPSSNALLINFTLKDTSLKKNSNSIKLYEGEDQSQSFKNDSITKSPNKLPKYNEKDGLPPEPPSGVSANIN